MYPVGVACCDHAWDQMTFYKVLLLKLIHVCQNTRLNQWVCCWFIQCWKWFWFRIAATDLFLRFCVCRNVTPHSYLKVYHKDPNQAFNHNSRNNNGDARVSETFTKTMTRSYWYVYISIYLVISLHQVRNSTAMIITVFFFVMMSSSCLFKQKKEISVSLDLVFCCTVPFL